MTRHHAKARNRPARQHGIALVIALVFLLLLTIIGVTAMNTTTMQERMAGNARDRNAAFQVTEATLRVAEEEIRDGANTAQSHVHDEGEGPDWQNLDCGSSDVTTADSVDAPSDPPCYYIEESVDMALDTSSDPDLVYQITARGQGLSGDTTVILRSSYRVVGP